MASARTGAIRYEDLLESGLTLGAAVKILTVCMATNPPTAVALLGPPGLGKSSVVRQAAEAAGRKLRVTRMYYYNPVDWRGAPVGDLVAHKTRYLEPDFLPLEDLVGGKGDEEPMLWFFDDCTAASQEVQKVMYEVILDRTVCGRKVRDGVAFVAAGNRAEDRALAHEMSTALSTRYARVEVRPDLDEWLAWAASAGLAPELLLFMKNFGTKHLYHLDPAVKCWETPRTWEFVARFVESGAPVVKASEPLFASAVGSGGAREFVNYWALYKDLPDPARIVLAGDLSPKAPNRENPDRLYAFSAMLAAAVTRAPLKDRAQAARNHVAYIVQQFPGNEFRVQAYKVLTQTKGYKEIHAPLIMSKEFLEFARMVKDMLDVK